MRMIIFQVYVAPFPEEQEIQWHAPKLPEASEETAITRVFKNYQN
jgi:hypothetical protein